MAEGDQQPVSTRVPRGNAVPDSAGSLLSTSYYGGVGMYAAAAAGAQRVRRIAVLGARGVGKSALTIRFCEGTFPESYLPTIEDTYQTTLRGRDGTVYALEIVDTAGQDEYSSLGAQATIGIDGYVLLYSVRDASSFEMVRYIFQRLVAILGSDQIPMILVGNQIDQALDREVSFEEGAHIAETIGAAFCECSARTGTNVAEVFRILLDEIERSASDDGFGPIDEEDQEADDQYLEERDPKTWRAPVRDAKTARNRGQLTPQDPPTIESSQGESKPGEQPRSAVTTSSSSTARRTREAVSAEGSATLCAGGFRSGADGSGSMLLSRCGLQ
jgi:Ras family protein